jgi:CheY-like chemotaxis protein
VQSYSPPAKRVLWVDDHPENNEPMAGDLERRGIHVSIARSTELALVLLERNRYAAVISDMGRKEGPREGLHLLDRMRARGDNTPFFIFAGLKAPELEEEALIHDAHVNTNNWLELLRALDALILGGGSAQAQLAAAPRRGDA